jgi:hypothetical protein
MQPLVTVQVPVNLEQNKLINCALTTPNPIRVPAYELPAFHEAIAVFNQLQPSSLAGLTGSIFPSVKQVDDVFNKSIEDYKNRLLTASGRDVAQNIAFLSCPKTYAASVGATEILTEYTPEIPVIKQFTIPILFIFGIFWGLYHKDKIVKEKGEENKSIHRKKWVNYVSIQEENRVENNVKFPAVPAEHFLEEI